MIEVSVSQVKSGDVLAKPVCGRNGVILLDAGTTLNDHYISRLRQLDVKRVCLRPRHTWGFTDRQKEYEQAKDEWELPDIARIKEDKSSLETAVQAALDFAKEIRGLEGITLPVPEEQFRKKFRDIIGEIVSNRELAEELSVMMQTDAMLYQKALQVSLISNAVGTYKHYDADQLYELTLGSIFSDVGMTRLPSNLIKVKRELTAVERMKLRGHTMEGYKILTKMKQVPVEAAKVALQHHERYHGGGYPFGLKAGEISEYAQIVGLTDVYNALISPRHYRGAYKLEEALEYLFAAGNHEFEHTLVQLFLQHLNIYPVSTHVLLSNGQAAFVVEAAGRPLMRPVVQVYRDADGSAIASPFLLDLYKHPDIWILRRLH